LTFESYSHRKTIKEWPKIIIWSIFFGSVYNPKVTWHGFERGVQSLPLPRKEHSCEWKAKRLPELWPRHTWTSVWEHQPAVISTTNLYSKRSKKLESFWFLKKRSSFLDMYAMKIWYLMATAHLLHGVTLLLLYHRLDGS